MAETPNLTQIANLSNETTALTAINNNFSAITTAFEDVLSLSGVSPNQMLSEVDMNSNQIINLPAPATANSPVRLQDLSNVTGGGTVSSIPTGGTTGQLLAKSSNADFATTWENASGLTAGTGITISAGTVSVTPTAVSAGSYGSSTSIPSLTVNAEGQLTAAAGNVVIAPAGTLSGTALPSTVVTSSLTQVGTVNSGTWEGTVVGPAYGGTGVANNSSSTLTVTGSYPIDLTVSGSTSLTLPTSGTVTTTSNANTFTAAQTMPSSVISDGYGGTATRTSLYQDVTMNSGTSTVVTSVAFPANCIVLAASAKITTALAGASLTTWEYGPTGGTASAFGSSLPLTAGTTNAGVVGPYGNYSSTTITFTAAAGVFTSGVIRLVLWFIQIAPPTS